MPTHNLPIYINLYQLNKSLHLAVKGFPKEKKYTLGEDILRKNWECLDLVVAINALPKEKKEEKITELSVVFDCLKIRLRMAQDIGVISEKQYAHIQTEHMKCIGEMIGGWLNWARGL